MPQQTDELYQSFLLRCWLTLPATIGQPAAWRFELQEIAAVSQTHRFNGLEQLGAFLSARLTGANQESDIAADDKESRL